MKSIKSMKGSWSWRKTDMEGGRGDDLGDWHAFCGGGAVAGLFFGVFVQSLPCLFFGDFMDGWEVLHSFPPSSCLPVFFFLLPILSLWRRNTHWNTSIRAVFSEWTPFEVFTYLESKYFFRLFRTLSIYPSTSHCQRFPSSTRGLPFPQLLPERQLKIFPSL